MKVGYPHMIRMKPHLQSLGIKRLGSADCGVKNLTAVGETRWMKHGKNLDNMEGFYRQAAEAIRWLDGGCEGAWRYGARYRAIEWVELGGKLREFELQHIVQFEHTSDALLFKLSYRP